MLEALARVFDEASLVVTYNGRTFDVPLMETRWAYHRRDAPTADLPHFDMLPAARRLWSRRDGMAPGDEWGGCSLTAIERRVLRFHRVADVPGFEIPARYFHFLRYGDASALEGVLEHNRHDLVSLAALMARALWLAREGPDACGEATEMVGLGRLYVRAGDLALAERAFTLAASAGDTGVRPQALARLAELLSRQRRHREAAAAWQAVLDDASRPADRRLPLARRAAEALAIHHEHRARDLRSAHRYASTLNGGGSRRQQQDFERRLARLRRKMSGASADRSLQLDE
jgi:tetratricopeptide (TPR) repeat protein